MAPGIMVSIQEALDRLQSCNTMNKYGFKYYEVKEVQDYVIFRLRSLRTFVICSTKLGDDVQMMSLWGRLDDVFRRILDDEFSGASVSKYVERFFDDTKPLVEEMDEWLITLSDYDLQQSTGLPARVSTSQGIDDILGSVVENFENFLMSCNEEYDDIGYIVKPIEALREYMVFLRNFIGFASLVCGDQHQEVQNLFTDIEALAVSAAHLAVYIFTCEDINRLNSINSALQLRIKPFHNPRLCETYSQALSSLRNPREFYDPALRGSSVVMMNLTDYLLYLVWDMLQSDVAFIIPLHSQLETLYDGLRCLGTQLRKLPNMFHGEIRDTTRVAICNAGVIIFSLHQKDFVIGRELQDFLGNVKVIQSEFEEKKLKFPGATVLDFLDSLLYYVEKVSSFKVDSNVLSCVPKIREDLVFLTSLMGILMELRKDHEDLHQSLWNLGVEVAYKLESLVDQLVLGDILGSFSPSFLSIAADMKIIKTDASKIFEVKEKVKGN